MKTKLLMTMLLASLVALGSGCAVLVVGGVAAGAGTVVWIKGEVRDSEAVSFDKAWDAAQAGLKDMECAITGKQQGVAEASLTARGAGDKKIQVTLKKVSGTVTEFRIRVGTFGDETLSRQILEKIKNHLK
jgi:hypothetical protein